MGHSAKGPKQEPNQPTNLLNRNRPLTWVKDGAKILARTIEAISLSNRSFHKTLFFLISVIKITLKSLHVIS